MRLRTLKPEFFQNHVLGSLTPLARILFAGLWCYADREGRFKWEPPKIKAVLLPYDNCDVEKLLAALVSAEFITRYGDYGCVTKFSEHQRPHHKEQPSKLPAPTKDGASTDLGECKNALSLGSGELSLGSDTPKPPKGVERFHEDTDYVCDYFDTGLRFWRPKATNKPRSIQNRRAVSKLLSDHADKERVVSVISFLFGACSPDPQSYDYRPEDNGKFDWRVNCQSPKKLLKHWDALDALFQAAYDKAVAGV